MAAPPPGEIPCPSCGQPLALPVEAVLAGRAIVCAGCGLELTAQRDASRQALDALGRWYSETAAARKAAVAGGAPGPQPKTEEASRRAGRPRR